MMNKRKEQILDFSVDKIQQFEELCTKTNDLGVLYENGKQQFGWNADFAPKRVQETLASIAKMEQSIN